LDHPTFLSEATLEAALAMLEEDRPGYSLDEHYAQMGIGGDGVPAMLREAAIAAAGDLSCLVRDGRIAVYREVSAPADWDHAAETRPHRSWSHDAALAHAHWGEPGGVRWLLSAHVAACDVDEAATIAMNANPMLADEGEIRLKPDVEPTIASCSRRPDGHRHPTL
jgi:hypothetical protein